MAMTNRNVDDSYSIIRVLLQNASAAINPNYKPPKESPVPQSSDVSNETIAKNTNLISHNIGNIAGSAMKIQPYIGTIAKTAPGISSDIHNIAGDVNKISSSKGGGTHPKLPGNSGGKNTAKSS
jgi:hypothetical protein